jgi:DNA-binding winged helix-turn-helix (wHTH) protein
MARNNPGILVYRRMDDVEEAVALRQNITTIGRADTCTLQIALPVVSRLHARVELQHERYVLFDEGSANGTFVNGRRVAQGQHLRTGDEIWLGSDEVALRFSDPEQTLMVRPNGAPPALAIDAQARMVHVYGAPTQLSPLEYGLLLHLAVHAGSVCTREECFAAVWGQPYDHGTCKDSLNACVAKLRRNLRATARAAGHAPPAVVAVPRVGFRLDADVAFATAAADPAH